MRGKIVIRVLAMLTTVVTLCVTMCAAAVGAPSREVVIPRKGIGRVSLNELHGSVDYTLGAGLRITTKRRGVYYRYRSGAISLTVGYGPSNWAVEIDTESPDAVVYGRRLGEGFKVLAPLLAAHGWRVLGCDGEQFTSLIPGGPGTGIAWRNSTLVLVQIDAGGSIGEQCLA